jgi:membrane-bound serine protease (ClpP class)
MSIFFILILIFFGIALIVLEILIVPGLVVGIAGAIFMLMGILWSWQIFGHSTGIAVGITSMILLAVTLYLATKSAFWKRFSLKGHSEGRMNEIEAGAVLPGDSGHAISSLRPMGSVRINGKKFEATSEGELIPANYPVTVIRVEPGRIVVKPKMD